MTQASASKAALRKGRRLSAGGSRPKGHSLQAHSSLARRKNPARLKLASDPSLSSCGGLVPFGVFARQHGVDRELALRFEHLKAGRLLVYRMSFVLRLLLDAQLVGEFRPFGLERLAADPLFRTLAGDHVPSVDVLYRDLARFDDDALVKLEELMAEEGLSALRERVNAEPLTEVHLDLDTTAEPLFGEQIEGGVPGANHEFRGRPCYHPLLLRLKELNRFVGARLRPGNTSFGNDDVEYLRPWVRRVKQVVGPHCRIYLRMDAGGDCAALMKLLEEEQLFYILKARLTPDIRNAIAVVPEKQWTTTDVDADLQSSEQVAEVPFQRDTWKSLDMPVRVVAVRSLERGGKPVYLWEDADYTAQAYLTNDPVIPLEDVAHEYDGRAGIEPLISEQKSEWGIGAVPTQGFTANHVMLLLKLYAFNLWKRYVELKHPQLQPWRTTWQRRVLMWVPARLVSSGGQVTVKLPPYMHSTA